MTHGANVAYFRHGWVNHWLHRLLSSLEMRMSYTYTSCAIGRRLLVFLMIWAHDDVIKWKHFPLYWPFVPGEFPTRRPVTRSFDVFFDLHPNKLLSKQWWGWSFETPSYPLWRHRNETFLVHDLFCGDPSGGFLSKRVCESGLAVFFVVGVKKSCWTSSQVAGNWNAVTIMWRYCNAQSVCQQPTECQFVGTK